jgi:hypothetical protein
MVLPIGFYGSSKNWDSHFDRTRALWSRLNLSIGLKGLRS